MINLTTRIRVQDLSTRELLEFMLTCTDERYRRWWPGTHFRFHTVGADRAEEGSRMYMDEYVGSRRLRFHALVTTVEADRIVWRFLVGPFRLPVWLDLRAQDDGGAAAITHTIRAGWSGVGRILDPLFRLYLTPGLERDLDHHVRTEFPMLRDMLRSGSPGAAPSPAGGPS